MTSIEARYVAAGAVKSSHNGNSFSSVSFTKLNDFCFSSESRSRSFLSRDLQVAQNVAIIYGARSERSDVSPFDAFSSINARAERYISLFVYDMVFKYYSGSFVLLISNVMLTISLGYTTFAP